MLKRWTISRASGAGTIAGLASLALWPAYDNFAAMRLPFLAALAVTAFCGLSILWITASDISIHSRRGARLRALRSFDLALALLLAGPSLLTLHAMLL